MGKNIHRYVELSTLIFGLVFVGHALRVAYGWELVVPQSWSILIAVVAGLMTLLGISFLRK